MRQRSQRHVVRIALDHTGLEALGDPPALLQQRRLDRSDARDVKRRQANLADMRQQVALQTPLHVADRARAPLEHVVLKPTGGIRAKRQIVLLAGAGTGGQLRRCQVSGADLRKLLLQRDHRTTTRPALTIAAQAHPVAPSVDGQTQIERLRAVHLCTDIHRSAIGPRHPALLLDLRRLWRRKGTSRRTCRSCLAADPPGSPRFGTRCPKHPAEPGRYRVLPALPGRRTAEIFPCKTAISMAFPRGFTRERSQVRNPPRP